MNSQSVTLFSSIAAFLTALAAIATAVVQLVVAKSNQRAAHRLELSKLFYHSRSEAYQQFLSALQNYISAESSETYHKLQTARTYAMIFSSPETSQALNTFSGWTARYHCSGCSSSIQKDYERAQTAAVEAMRSELTQLLYQHPCK